MNLTILLQVSGPAEYFSLIKLGVVAVLFVGICFAYQWVDIDTDRVKTRRERWNLIVLVGGLGGLAIMFLIPWAGSAYFLGLAFYIVMAGGSVLLYVMHRNGRVIPDQKVLTIAHLKRIVAGGEKDETAKIDKGQRIQLADHTQKDIGRPTDREAFEHYAAVQDLMFDILWRRSSDAEILVGKEELRLVYKIDGVTSSREDVVSREEGERALTFIKKLAGLNPDEIRRPQEGAFFAGLLGDAEMSRIGVVTSGSTLGERVRIRVQQSASKRRLGEIGLASSRLELVRTFIKRDGGLFVVSGPNQSGVTTTLYSILREHDAFMENIHTLESRPLYELDNITQAEHKGASSDVSFARQLQSVLRREPDIVGVGHCEDRETAQIALRAAEGGRKVYMAIEAKSTFDALSRLMNFAEDNKLVANSVIGVINQRLVRLLCGSCRQSFKPDESLLRKANLPVNKIENFHRPPTEAVFDKKGREIICQSCQGSGYVGRTAVFELLEIDEKVRKLIAGGAPIKQIKAQARAHKMYYLQEAGLLKVINGSTSLDEIIRGLRDSAKK